MVADGAGAQGLRLTLIGVVVVADGAGGAEGGLDCDNNTFTAIDGTLNGCLRGAGG
ncbi:MAG: hypothetical protein IT481_12740 [Gammaproteobacteria bacterium]|nr:hypothetical protein [Gammaproteobacteria bacterium]